MARSSIRLLVPRFVPRWLERRHKRTTNSEDSALLQCKPRREQDSRSPFLSYRTQVNFTIVSLIFISNCVVSVLKDTYKIRLMTSGRGSLREQPLMSFSHIKWDSVRWVRAFVWSRCLILAHAPSISVDGNRSVTLCEQTGFRLL